MVPPELSTRFAKQNVSIPKQGIEAHARPPLPNKRSGPRIDWFKWHVRLGEDAISSKPSRVISIQRWNLPRCSKHRFRPVSEHQIKPDRLRKQTLLNRHAGIFSVESSSNRKGNLACDRRPVVLKRYGTPDLTTFNCVS